MKKKDYGNSGLTIRSAMLDDGKGVARASVADNYIIWGGREVRTSLLLTSPWEEGFIKLTFLKRIGTVAQGADMEAEGGSLVSAEGLSFKLLRTWATDEHEDEVEYRFHAPRKELWVWNVYKMQRGTRQVEEKWTENAGFLVEKPADNSYVLHCSHGGATPPDFESLVFRIDLRPLRSN